MSEFTFDTVSGGDWVKGSEHVNEWVLIRIRDTSTRDGVFGEQIVMDGDWVFDLLNENESKLFSYGVLNSDQFIAGKCVGKNLVVGVIRRGVPKQKGFQGAVYLDQPEGEDMTKAITIAKAILEKEKETKAKSKISAKTEAASNPAEQELTNLLEGL